MMRRGRRFPAGQLHGHGSGSAGDRLQAAGRSGRRDSPPHDRPSPDARARHAVAVLARRRRSRTGRRGLEFALPLRQRQGQR